MKVYFKSIDSNDNKISFLSTASKIDNKIEFKDMSMNNTFIQIEISDSELIFIRSGEVKTTMKFVLNKTTPAYYENMLGLEFDFNVFTTNLVIFENEIKINYNMILDGEEISKHEISLLIKQNT